MCGYFKDEARTSMIIILRACCTLLSVAAPWRTVAFDALMPARPRPLPGVVGVFTGRDFAGHLKPIRIRVAGLPRFEEFLQIPLAIEKVRYVGEPIAVVIAETPYLAEDALSLISVGIDELPPIVTWAQAAENKEFIHEAVGTNITGNFVGRGDADQAFSTAHYTRRERFSVQRHTAMPMETRGLVGPLGCNSGDDDSLRSHEDPVL